MTTDKTPATLATVKHGGSVQLGDGLPPLPIRQRFTTLHGETYAYSAEQMREYALAALSVQPSPGGQGKAFAEALQHYMRDESDKLPDEVFNLPQEAQRALVTLSGLAASPMRIHPSDAKEAVEYVIAALLNAVRQPVRIYGCCSQPEGELHTAECPNMRHLDARQPVGELVITAEMLAAADAYHDSEEYRSGQFSDSHTNAACYRAMAAVAPPAQAVDLPYSLDADPAGIRARVADVITGTLMVGAQGHTPPPAGHWAEPFWQAARADAKAQAVDLGPVRSALQAAEALCVCCASVDGYSRSELNAFGQNMRSQFTEALALIDSQAVGNG